MNPKEDQEGIQQTIVSIPPMTESQDVAERYEDVESKEELTNLLSTSDDDQSDFLLVDDHHQSGSRDLLGFYTYSFASEVFSIVSSGLLLPITLEQLGRDNGYTFPNHQFFCPGSVNAIASKTPPVDPKSICQVKFLGRWVDTASFPLYVLSFGVALQAFLVASFGDAADDTKIRKSLLLFFTAIGSLSGIAFFFLDGSLSALTLGAILTIIGNAALGVSTVCLNSYIPHLAKTRPKVLEAERQALTRPSSIDDEDVHYKTLLSNATADISSKGIAIGYGSGIFTLCISLVLISSHAGSTDSLKSTIGSSAVWWAVFTIPCIFWLPPARAANISTVAKAFDPVKNYHHIVSMLREYKQLKNTIRFLMAWFLLSDAISTLMSTAIVYSKTTLEMPSSHIVLLAVLAPMAGIIGASTAPMIQSKLKYCSGLNGSLQMFKLLVGASCMIPAYVSMATVLGIAALASEFEMFLIAAIFGFVFGAFQSYARSVYAELIPPGQEAKWYALYSITDKSSSFFGPFFVGFIADYTHNIRYGFIFILAIQLLSFPLLNRVDLTVGKANAEQFSQAVKRT